MAFSLKGPRLALAAAILAAGTMGARAQETSYLRLGMSPDSAASVYTQLRSCSNAPFFETADSMRWEGALYGGDAEIAIRFADGVAAEIAYRVTPAAGGSVAAIFKAAADDMAASYGRPAEAKAGSARWRLADGELVVEAAGGAVEIVLRRRTGG